MLAIQRYIRDKGLDAAIEEFKLVVNKDGPLVQLNYSMIDSPKAAQECCECRGLILDSGNDWNVVAYPFYRFFNAGEGPAAIIDLSIATLQAKEDGSLCTVFWHPYKERMTVSTRGRINADGNVGKNPSKTFSDLFWNTAREVGMPQGISTLRKGSCYTFELTGPENRVLTSYAKAGITLLGARDLETLEEYNNNRLDCLAGLLGVPRPKQYTFNSREDIQKILDSFKPTEEGFVLVDYSIQVNGNFPRVKIKNPRYLALSHLLGAGDEDLLNSKKLVTLIQTGEISEVITYFPEYAPQITVMREKLDNLAKEFDFEYSNIRNLGNDRKTYAAAAKKYRYPAALFSMLDGKVPNSQDYVLKMRPDVLLTLINEK